MNALGRALQRTREPNLSNLALSHNQIDSAGLKAIARAVPHLTRLTQLRLNNNRALPEAIGVRALHLVCSRRSSRTPFDVLQLPPIKADTGIRADPHVAPDSPRESNLRGKSSITPHRFFGSDTNRI